MNEKRSLTCPQCALPSLREIVRYDVEIDTCQNCFGIWFDADEMIAYARGRKALRQDSAPPSEPFVVDVSLAPAACPRCSMHSLEAGAAGPLRMRHCLQCKGVYLPLQTHKAIFEPPVVPGIKKLDIHRFDGAFSPIHNVAAVDLLSTMTNAWFL